ncbi:uncharacterized protein F4822DRAFT_442916 [Hypoxylon trugodes]|uniref:uncharacterized protein n=1 Tax=Hypoxylon trugodes TaxID=326681 RepID=UPI002196051C|nr:uncharacterized protein F4822DRAFT_442916 [Hypoxylon trugodes]KAI1389723.1 hypothetical protein F4822DRAFT_442916 [Hypoxylon trugodes]
MKSIVFRVAFLAIAASVNAQDSDSSAEVTTTTTTACAAQNILDTCLSTTESYVSLCATTDYMCLCDKYTAIMTCFNNCPNDSRQATYQQQKDSYCMNASLYATTSGNRTVSRSISTTSSPVTTTSATNEGNVKTADITATASTPTATEAAQSSSNGGDEQRMSNPGGLLAAFAGVLAALL